MLSKSQKQDKIILKPKKSEDKEAYKNSIISELYINGIILNKIQGILFRHKKPTQAQLDEDLNQIVFLELCRKSADEIIEMYEDNPSRLVGLGVRIAVIKGVAKSKTNNPNVNFIDFALHFSSLNQVREDYAMDYFMELLLDENTDLTDEEIERVNISEYLKARLSITAKEALEQYEKDLMTMVTKDRKLPFWKYYTKRTTDKRKLGTLLVETHIIINNKLKTNQMNKEELLSRIENILPQIKQYQSTRKVGHLTTEDILEIKAIYDTYINPAGKLMTSCSSCVKDAMDIMESFYSANKLKQAPEAAVAETEQEKPAIEAKEKITFEIKPETVKTKKNNKK